MWAEGEMEKNESTDQETKVGRKKKGGELWGKKKSQKEVEEKKKI